jgi:hypothetical protein
MNFTRRSLLQAAGSTALLGATGAALAQSASLKISHQFPGGSLTEGDFRDRLCRQFAPSWKSAPRAP